MSVCNSGSKLLVSYSDSESDKENEMEETTEDGKKTIVEDITEDDKKTIVEDITEDDKKTIVEDITEDGKKTIVEDITEDGKKTIVEDEHKEGSDKVNNSEFDSNMTVEEAVSKNDNKSAIELETKDDCKINEENISRSVFRNATVEYYSESSCSSSDGSESSSSNSESSSESSEESSSEDEEKSEDKQDAVQKEATLEKKNGYKGRSAYKTEGELGINELPAIEHLNISVKEVDLVPLGCVLSMVDHLVVVQSRPNTPALNLNTALFTKNGECVGQVFETFGPVVQPFYVMRFNNDDEIIKRNLNLNVEIYFAPCKSELTEFVFTEQLRCRGSDASWKDDNEPPEDQLEYSDDEQEKLAKLKRKNKFFKGRDLKVDTPNSQNMYSGWPPRAPALSGRAKRRLGRGSLRNPFHSGVCPQTNAFVSPQPRNVQPVTHFPPMFFMTDYWRNVPPPQFN